MRLNWCWMPFFLARRAGPDRVSSGRWVYEYSVSCVRCVQVLPVRNKMREPSALGGTIGVLNTAMTVVTCAYLAVAFFGYLKFGAAVEGALTLSMPRSEPLFLAALPAYALAIFFSYGLQLYVPMLILADALGRSDALRRRPLLLAWLDPLLRVLIVFLLCARTIHTHFLYCINTE